MKVLVVDDRKYMRVALRGYLTLHTEFEVCGEASDGVEAITQARKLHPDIVVMDLAMPTLTGAEAALVIKNILPEVRIVMFTLSGDLAGNPMAKKLGVDLVVPKADGATGLINALHSLLAASPNPHQPPGHTSNE
jgi:DNA-binding NarL/FixJ family response regulator